MKITTKINLLTTAWLVVILLIMNIVVFFSFTKSTVNMEQDILFEKAREIIQKGQQDHSVELSPELLKFYLTNHSFIRTISENSTVINQVSNDPHLVKIKPEFSKKKKVKLRKIREKQVLVIRMPVKVNNQVVETLEIGELLTGFETRKDILLSILIFCSLVSILLSLLGGRWLSRVIMHPIKNMVTTMKEIEESGVPKKVLIQTETRDELQGMTVTFNHMIDRLRENIEKQNQFVSDASHELKTPLTVIRSYSNLLRRRGIKNEEITLDAIDTIYAEATKMQKMIETLLDLASVEKEQTLDMKQTDLVLIFEQIVKQLQQVYKRELVLHYDQTPIMIEVDELKMKQVLIILLDNAIKYSTDKIEVTVEKEQEDVIIKVKDYGIGIPKEDLAHIFERFYRVDKARSRATGGTGLGLSIAQTIVRQHKGEIFIKSEEEQGTEVVIHLPISSTN